jgi:hypothetical protein
MAFFEKLAGHLVEEYVQRRHIFEGNMSKPYILILTKIKTKTKMPKLCSMSSSTSTHTQMGATIYHISMPMPDVFKGVLELKRHDWHGNHISCSNSPAEHTPRGKFALLFGMHQPDL